MSATGRSSIPQFQLLCIEEQFSDAFKDACESLKLPPSVSIQIHNCSLSRLPSTVQFDTIVSPANSYGRLDGTFDDAISRVISPRNDYFALTSLVQAKLYEQWRGFAPPGTCTLVRIPDAFHARSNNIWGVRRVALCPTMREPGDVRWDREIVYECVWSLLCAIDNHNRSVREGKSAGGKEEIRTVLMTPLATGVGRVSAKRWALQAVLAMVHFQRAMENPETWSALEWDSIGDISAEIQPTLAE